MKIVQFTDIHIGAIDEVTRDVDVRGNLSAILPAIANENADLIVLSGDLCFNAPNKEIYTWIHGQFDAHNLNPIVLNGNHDDSTIIAQEFDMPIKGNEVYFARDTGDLRFLFLDTGRGELSAEQWLWLESQLATPMKVMIFMHHPPVHANVPFMDNSHAFTQQKQFQELIARRDDCVEVFCGHYHVDKSISMGNLHVHITPSCFFQIRDDIQEFGVDHYRIGYRVIEVDSRLVSHGVRYL